MQMQIRSKPHFDFKKGYKTANCIWSCTVANSAPIVLLHVCMELFSFFRLIPVEVNSNRMFYV